MVIVTVGLFWDRVMADRDPALALVFAAEPRTVPRLPRCR